MYSDEMYTCYFCGKRHVKLWYPEGNPQLLICAECAEKNQSKIQYSKRTWRVVGKSGYIGIPTGKTAILKPWTVDEIGTVPSYNGPGPRGNNPSTHRLIVNLTSFFPEYSEQTCFLPAIPNGRGGFYEYPNVFRKYLEYWEKLPTR